MEVSRNACETGKKAEELRCFNHVLSVWPQPFPKFKGAPRQPKEPAADIELCLPDNGVYGIAITRLTNSQGKEIDAARKKLLKDADERLALALSGHRVSVGFSLGALPPHRVALEEFCSYLSSQLELARIGIRHAEIVRPAFISNLVVSEPLRVRRGLVPGGVFTVRSASYADVEAQIRAKERRIPGYKRTADRTALLIYVPMSPSLAQLAIPREADSWVFNHSFNQVLLFAEDSDGNGLIYKSA